MATPVKFISLTIRNFMSYGNNDTVINLNFNQPTLIVGKNLDAIVNGQVDSNGAGKSAILDALAFALYDKTISNKEKSDIINVINKKNLEVTVIFEKNGATYKVTRIRKTKTKADIRFLIMDENGEWLDKTLDNITHNNVEIARIIGFPFDVFSRIIVFSASFEPFLDLPSRHATKPNQTDIMEEVFGYTELSEKAEALKDDIKITKADFLRIQELQEQTNAEMGRHEELLEKARIREHDWGITQAEDIQARKSAITELSKIDFDAERDLLQRVADNKEAIQSQQLILKAEKEKLTDKKEQRKSHEVRASKLEESAEKIKLIAATVDFETEDKILFDLQEAELESTHNYDTAQALKSTIARATKELNKLETQVEHLNDDKCPFCEQTFEDANAKLAEIETEIATIKSSITEDNEKYKDASTKEAEADAQVATLKELSVFKGSSRDYDAVVENYNKHKSIVDSAVNDVVDMETLNTDISEIKETIIDLEEGLDKLQDNNIIEAASRFDSSAHLEREAATLDSCMESLDQMKDAVNPHTDAYEELKKIEFNSDRSEELNTLDETLLHQEFLLKLLTKKDSFVRKELLNLSLPFLNKRLMVYLEQLGLPHRVEFLPDMSAQISQFGTALHFSSLSSGQRARVNLALAFAFRDVLQARYGKISFCMLDECLDTGLGNVGVQLAAKMIKKIATDDDMSMFVISHRDEISNMFPEKLIVQLENGFSTIVSE